MARMKLKTLLKVVNASEIEITVKTNGSYKNYYVNYLKAHEPTYDSSTYMSCGATSLLPEEIMDRAVTFVDAYKSRVSISCY